MGDPFSPQMLTRELLLAAQEARAAKQPGPAVAAYKAAASMHALVVRRTEDVTRSGKLIIEGFDTTTPGKMEGDPRSSRWCSRGISSGKYWRLRRRIRGRRGVLSPVTNGYQSKTIPPPSPTSATSTHYLRADCTPACDSDWFRRETGPTMANFEKGVFTGVPINSAS